MAFLPKNVNEVMYEGGKKHFLDVIKSRSNNDTLIFKNPEEDFNTGSTLIVEPGEQAVFINGGNIENIFSAGTYVLDTSNYPFISRLRNALSGGISSFHCEVYFVRIASSREIKWGTDSPVKVYDKALLDPFTGLGVETEVRARGSYKVEISDSGLFLSQLIGGNYDLNRQEDLNEFFRNQFLGDIVSCLSKELSEWDGPLIQAASQGVKYAKSLQISLNSVVGDFGIRMTNFNIRMDIVDNQQRQQAMELVSKNREAYYSNMAAGAGESAFAQGQQQAYAAYGTNYQQAQVLSAMNSAAANPGNDSGSLVGAGLGLTMGAGLGQAVPDLLNQAMSEAGGKEKKSEDQTDSKKDPVERLKNLKKLFDMELISEKEYETKKTQILNDL